MADYNFKSDIKLGEAGELDVIKYLTSKGGKFISNNKNNTHDLIMEFKGEQISYEIKSDVFVWKLGDTGNMFIETECRNKPSGLSVTKAKWFVTYFVHLKEIWFIKTKDLKQLIAENNFPLSTNAGDVNSNTKGYLINRKSVRNKFKVVNV